MTPTPTSPHRAALRAALRTSLWTRALVMGVAIYASLTMTISGGRQDVLPGGGPDPLLHPFSETPLRHVLSLLLEPLARWDARWYLGIADHGYEAGPGVAFFPGYPALVWLTGGAGHSRGFLMVAAYAVSLVAFGAALYFLHRLVELELGRSFAAPAVLLLAVFPGALYFGAPYSESLFLLVTVGAFYAARTGHWAWAGAAAAAASATRGVGLLLLVPLLVLYLHGPREDRAPDRPGARFLRYRPRRDACWLALAPAGLVAFSIHLGRQVGDPLVWATVQDSYWGRRGGIPFQQVWAGAVEAVSSAGELLGGFRDEHLPGTPYNLVTIHAENVVLIGFLAFTLAATVGTLRRLPLAYGAWALAAIAVPLTYSFGLSPLQGLHRYVSVVFPLFVWLALVAEERGITARIAAVSTALLAMFTVQFATWHWWV